MFFVFSNFRLKNLGSELRSTTTCSGEQSTSKKMSTYLEFSSKENIESTKVRDTFKARSQETVDKPWVFVELRSQFIDKWRVVYLVWKAGIKFFILTVWKKNYHSCLPYCVRQFASLRPQAKELQKVQRKSKKRRGFFEIGKEFIPACQSGYTFLFVSH